MKLTTKLLLGATLIAGLSISAFAACASDVDFGSTDGTNGKNITGLKDPANPQDAATKAYVDEVIGYKDKVSLTCNGTYRVLTTASYRSGVISGVYSFEPFKIGPIANSGDTLTVYDTGFGTWGLQKDINGSATINRYQVYLWHDTNESKLKYACHSDHGVNTFSLIVPDLMLSIPDTE